MRLKHEYEGQLNLLLDAINEGTVPAHLQEALTSLRHKVQAEKDRYESFFQRDEQIHRQPSMGVVELAAEYSDTPQHYFGADVPVRSAVRVKVFQAYRDLTTNDICKADLLSEVVMSAKQFGDLIAAPNRGSGYPVTFVRIPFEGEFAPYDPATDPTKESIQRLNDPVKRSDGRASERMSNLRKLMASAMESGRITKKEASTLASAAHVLSSQMPSNTAYQINRLSEEFQNRTNEVSLNVHLDMNALAQKGRKRLKQENDHE